MIDGAEWVRLNVWRDGSGVTYWTDGTGRNHSDRIEVCGYPGCGVEVDTVFEDHETRRHETTDAAVVLCLGPLGGHPLDVPYLRPYVSGETIPPP